MTLFLNNLNAVGKSLGRSLIFTLGVNNLI